jgi:hypothetical protein
MWRVISCEFEDLPWHLRAWVYLLAGSLAFGAGCKAYDLAVSLLGVVR